MPVEVVIQVPEAIVALLETRAARAGHSLAREVVRGRPDARIAAERLRDAADGRLDSSVAVLRLDRDGDEFMAARLRERAAALGLRAALD
ncbi:MAG: hypothetical protein Q7K37_12410 [Dehalococcoidia bacterium]|nr:hypothetical protein [Dehalococcoidia bacterium]